MKRFQSLGRLKTGVMNKTESAYERVLWGLHHEGAILWYKFEGIKLRLADNTFLTPDFFVMRADFSLECHEVKGNFVTDDGWAKLKIAADMFPFRFYKVTQQLKRLGGAFNLEIV